MIKILNRTILVLFAAALAWGCAKEDGGSEGDTPPAGSDTFGYVTDNTGTPLEGVVVSDGYTSVQTDAQGMYKFVRNAQAYYVYYTLPAAYQVKIGSTGIPEFFTRLNGSKSRYDFTLTPLTTPETQFRLVCIGDPQVNDAANVSRFKNESVIDIKNYMSKSTVPVYAICLGDLVNNKWNLFPNMLAAMQQPKVGMPVFQTIGNHDHENKANNDLLAQRTYEAMFGPVNYSFDRGDTHIISMDNVIHGCQGESDNYEGGFLEWQYKWLEQDLSFVPKDKMVILCVHIPFRGGAASGGGSMNKDKYYTETLNLLAQYKSATIMSAHTHSNLNYIHNINGKEIYEHITGTTCGAWWKSTVCTEGTPNGYAVYEINGTEVEDWVYKAVKYPDTYQIRLYRGSDKFMGGTKGFQFSKTGANQIVANIWNSDPTWTVNVYEDETLTGAMSRYTDRDAWTVAYHVGALGGSDSYNKTADHLYHYTLTKPGSVVRVEAIDTRNEKTYTQNMFTDPNSSPATY